MSYGVDCIKRARLKIRATRKDFFGNVRSTYVKQARSNAWGNARFKPGYAKKLAATYPFRKELERQFSNCFHSTYFLSNGTT